MYKGMGGVSGLLDKLKVGPPCHYCTDSGAVFSVGDRDVHNPQDRLRRILAAAWHPTNLR